MISLPFPVSSDEDSPQTPVVAMVVDASGRIRALQPGTTGAIPALLETTLEQAIHSPAVGCRAGLPAMLQVDQEELHAQLLRLYPAIPTLIGPTPQLDLAAESFLNQLIEDLPEADHAEGGSAPERSDDEDDNDRDDDDDWDDEDWDDDESTYLSEGISAEAMAAFFAAAAELHRGGSWRRLGQEAPLFQLSCRGLGMRGWVGCVLGDEQELAALLCFRSLTACERYLQAARRTITMERLIAPSLPEHLALNYQPEATMPAPLLEEIQRQGWPVADDAFPLLMRIKGDLWPLPLEPDDLARLEVMVRGLTVLLDSPAAAAAGSPPQARQRFAVPLAGDTVAITIGWLTAPSPADPAAGASQAPPTAVQRKAAGTADPTAPALGRIPAALTDKVDALLAAIDPFCEEHLDGEYRQLIHKVLGALARKRPSPLLGGREPSWCAGIVHAVGMVNFLFDRSQSPHCTAPEIYSHFGVSSQTGQAHSKKVRDLLGMAMFDWQWTLPSRWDSSSMIWMIQVDGFHLDARGLSEAIQVEAWRRGLIPYVPAYGPDAVID